MDFSALYNAAYPYLIDAIAIVLTLAITHMGNLLRVRWGIEIEAAHRDALHAALMSGIRTALAEGLQGDGAINAAVAHARVSVPDAIAALSPAAGVLRTIATAKLTAAIGGVE